MRRLMWFSIGFLCACLAAVYLLPEGALPWAALFGGVLLVGALFALLCGRRRAVRGSERGKRSLPLRRCFCAFLGLSVGLLWSSAYERLVVSPAHALTGEYETLSAEACAWPVDMGLGQRVDAWVGSGTGRVRVRFYLYGERIELRPGDRFTGSFRLSRADRSADGELDYELRSKGVLLIGSGRVTSVEDGGDPLRYFPVRLSRRIFERLGALIPADAAGLPQAMLTGDRRGLSEAVREQLSAAGASHIVAVSGLHVAMLLGVLVLVLGSRGRLAAILGIPLLALFVLMTGASPSVIRAALMLGLLLLAPLLKEENDPPTSLAFAGLLILLVNPRAVANISFQLSFAAVAGLLLVTPPLLERFRAAPPVKRIETRRGSARLPRPLNALLVRVPRALVRFLCASTAATLGALCFSAPIAALYFGSMPVYAVLTNLLVLPLATLCLEGALLTLGLGLFSDAAGAFLGRLLAWPVRGICAVCRFVSELPGCRLWMDGYGLAFLLFAGGLLLLALLLREKKPARPLLALLAALLVAVCLQSAEAASKRFSFAALDVGQGQCVCFRTPDFSAVTDCGGSHAGEAATSWLRQHGAKRIDALILTHYDADHAEGAATLLSLLPVGTVWLPDVGFDPEMRAEVETAALTAGAELCYVNENALLPFPGGQLSLYAPVSDRNDNAACVCVLYSVGEYDMLVTGDLDAAGEYALLEREALAPVELYVAGHHGSNHSSTEALLDALRPDTVFVSVGRNGYGLPGAEALARIEAVGAAIYRTDECGNLEIGR